MMVMVLAAGTAHADGLTIEAEASARVSISLGGSSSEGRSPPRPPARADDPPGAWRETPLGRPRWEAQLAMQIGASKLRVDDVESMPRVGVTAALGRQLGPVRLAAEYGITPFEGSREVTAGYPYPSMTQDVSGQIHRIGAAARLRHGIGNRVMATGFYLELGAGRQSIRWSGGGEDERRDVALGFGVELGGGERRMGGFFLGGRVRATERPAPDETYDLAGFVELGALFGS